MPGLSLAVKGSDFLLGELILFFSGLDLLILWNDPKSLQGLSLNTHGSCLKNCYSCGEQYSNVAALLNQFMAPPRGHTFPVTESPMFKCSHSEESSNLPSNNCSEGPCCHRLLKDARPSPELVCCNSHSQTAKAKHLESFCELVKIKEIWLHKS